jgi:hypothetical protein
MYKRDKRYDQVINPRPYLPTALCRIVSIAAAQWQGGTANVGSFAKGGESLVVGGFLDYIGRSRPQLFSYNGQRADLPILLQRAALHRLQVPAFLKRPAKPWEGVDYFDRYSGWHVDLLDSAIGGGSLADLCAGLDIPGKVDVDGSSIADLWAAGKVDEIARYNEADAMRVLAIVARVGYMAGLLDVSSPPWAENVLDRHPEWADT